MTSVDLLNRRFAERLGRPNGIDPRFKWMHTADIPSYRVVNGRLERFSWTQHLGPCWVLCQWATPTVTREQWALQLGSQYPYPERGRYVPHAEVSLPRGMEPNDEQTEFYCRTLQTQMEMSWQEQLDRSQIQAEYFRKQADQQFLEQVGDWEPVNWKQSDPHEPGDQDGSIALQAGIGESPTLRKLQGAA